MTMRSYDDWKTTEDDVCSSMDHADEEPPTRREPSVHPLPAYPVLASAEDEGYWMSIAQMEALADAEDIGF